MPVKSRANILSPIDREIEQLIKQKGILNEKIASIKSDEKMDSKQKDERIKLLTMDLELLESQIMQKRMEKAENSKSDKSNKNNSSQKEDSSKNSEMDTSKLDISGASMEKLLQAGNLHEQLTKMASVRKSMKVEANNFRHEVRKGRAILEGENDPGDPGKTEMRKNLELTVNRSKNEQALEIDQKIAKLDREIGKKIEDTLEGVQKNDKVKGKVITEKVDDQEDVSVSDQLFNDIDTQNQDADKDNNNLQAQRNVSIGIRV